jgi:hypothetical protein
MSLNNGKLLISVRRAALTKGFRRWCALVERLYKIPEVIVKRQYMRLIREVI